MSDLFGRDGHLTWTALSARADGELAPFEAELAGSHLDSCTFCRDEERAMALVIIASSTPSGDAEVGVAPPARRAEAVRAALEAFDETSAEASPGPASSGAFDETPAEASPGPASSGASAAVTGRRSRRLARATQVAAAVLVATALSLGIVEIGSHTSGRSRSASGEPGRGEKAAVTPASGVGARVEIRSLIAVASCGERTHGARELILHYSWASGQGCDFVSSGAIALAPEAVIGTRAVGRALVVRLRAPLDLPPHGILVRDGRIVGKITVSGRTREFSVTDLTGAERARVERALGG